MSKDFRGDNFFPDVTIGEAWTWTRMEFAP